MSRESRGDSQDDRLSFTKGGGSKTERESLCGFLRTGFLRGGRMEWHKGVRGRRMDWMGSGCGGGGERGRNHTEDGC